MKIQGWSTPNLIWRLCSAHHSRHQEWRWQECPRRLSLQKESWRKDIMTQEEDFVRRSRSGVGSGSTYMHWNRCWSREVPYFHGTDSILSLSVCHKWNGSFTKRLQILIQRNDLRFFPTKIKLSFELTFTFGGGMRVETILKLFQSYWACDQGQMAETCNAEE